MSNLSLSRVTVGTYQGAIKLCHGLVSTGLVVSCHLKEIESIYWWDNKIENEKEWEITCTHLSSNSAKIRGVVQHFNDYDLTEVLTWEVEAAKGINEWVVANSKEHK